MRAHGLEEYGETHVVRVQNLQNSLDVLYPMDLLIMRVRYECPFIRYFEISYQRGRRGRLSKRNDNVP